MTVKTKAGQGLARGVAIACVLALVVAGALWWILREANEKRYTAMFTSVVGLYPGNDVRVLGIKVGRVDKVEPQGDLAKVEMLVDSDINIPANAQAVVFAPSLVSDRYVQLTPAYTGGPQLVPGSVIGKDRTATPLEVDDLYASLDRVSNALGPNGVNKNG